MRVKIMPCMENGQCAQARGWLNGVGRGRSAFHVLRADTALPLPNDLLARLNPQAVRDAAAQARIAAAPARKREILGRWL